MRMHISEIILIGQRIGDLEFLLSTVAMAMSAMPNKLRQDTSRDGCSGTLTQIFFNLNH